MDAAGTLSSCDSRTAGMCFVMCCYFFFSDLAFRSDIKPVQFVFISLHAGQGAIVSCAKGLKQWLSFILVTSVNKACSEFRAMTFVIFRPLVNEFRKKKKARKKKKEKKLENHAGKYESRVARVKPVSKHQSVIMPLSRLGRSVAKQPTDKTVELAKKITQKYKI